jgi:hypothetical protein
MKRWGKKALHELFFPGPLAICTKGLDLNPTKSLRVYANRMLDFAIYFISY